MSSSHPADRVWLPGAATPGCPAQCLAQASSTSLETIKQLHSPSTNCRPQPEVCPRLKCSPEKVCLPVTHCRTVRSIQGACRPSDQNCCCTQTGKLPSREGKGRRGYPASSQCPPSARPHPTHSPSFTPLQPPLLSMASCLCPLPSTFLLRHSKHFPASGPLDWPFPPPFLVENTLLHG